MAIIDDTKTLFAGSGTRMRTVAAKKFTVVKATEAIPFASVIGRLASGGSSPVDFRVRTGGDVTGSPEF